MNIQPIVEGHGEVPAVPVFLRRLRDEARAWGVEINEPIRQKFNALVQQPGLTRAIQLAQLQPDCEAILILLDSEDDCPKTLGPQLQMWAEAAARGFPCRVVLAHREYEAWFLAALESLRGVRGIRANAAAHPNPESPRDAKAQLTAQMYGSRSYSETADQPALSARFDLAVAYRGCRSFRKLTTAFGQLLQALGWRLPQWPPANW